jgi:preprotein translocase subunit SecD
MNKYLIISLIVLSFGCRAHNALNTHELVNVSDNKSGIFLFEEGGVVYPHFKDSTNTYSLAEKPTIPFSDFKRISKGNHASGSTIKFELNSSGTIKFEKLTTEYQYEKIAFVIDGLVVSTPVIYMTVSGGSVQISGLTENEADFIFQKAKTLK